MPAATVSMAGDGVGADAMTKLVPDKAEIALEYPEKFYVGTFERSSRFGAHLDSTGFSLVLDRPALKRCAGRFTCTSIMVCSLAF